MADGGVWVKVHPSQAGGPVEGAPPAPVLTNPEGDSVIKFTSGGDGDAGPTLAYGAKITPDATVVVDQDNLEVAVSGTTPDTDYVVEVFGMNVAGRGESATTDAFQLNYNNAIGGDDVKEYTRLSDSTRWRYHEFTTVGTSTFTVESNPKPDEYRVLVVAGGGAGGGSDRSGGGGGGGGMVEGTSLPKGSLPVVVGDGGASEGQNGEDSKIDSLIATGGGTGGAQGGSGGGGRHNSNQAGAKGIAGQGNDGGNGRDATNQWSGGGGGGAGARGSNAGADNGGHGGAGKPSDITGTSLTYAGGGGGGYAGSTARPGNPGDNTAGFGGGGQGTGTTTGGAKPGSSGVVIVAYQIGTSTTRQIEQAKAEHAAREAGYATGYDVGVTDGREQAVEAMAASTLEVQE